MKIKPVIKVMNFHSLIRVDASSKKAQKLLAMEKELSSMIAIILNNENLRLDKKIKLPDKSLPELNIFIGSDFGFCGSVNYYVSNMLASKEGTKIVLGKKARNTKNVELHLNQQDFDARFNEIGAYLREAVEECKWSSINLIYNKFVYVGSIQPVCDQIYPLDAMRGEHGEVQSGWDDFVFEGDEVVMLNDLFTAYLENRLKIAVSSAYAAENIIRQAATTQSLKKLDEIEEEETRIARKEHTAASFKKTIDSFIKQKAIQ